MTPRPATERRVSRWTRAVPFGAVPQLLLAACALLAPRPTLAQREFTRQAILINIFEGSDARLAREFTNELRARTQRAFPRRDLLVIGNNEIADLLDGSGIDVGRPLASEALRAVVRSLRADEVVTGRVARDGATVRVEARLALVRDERLAQPLRPVSAPSADSAAALLGRALRDARVQLVWHRRCENALRDNAPARAVELAKEGIARSPAATLVRTCLLAAYTRNDAPARELLREAELILADDPGSYWALDAGARAHDALGNAPRAADLWLRLQSTDTTDLDLAQRIVVALLNGNNAARARPLVTTLSDRHADDLSLLRLRWRTLGMLREWEEATQVGERLLAVDSTARGDSAFTLMLVSAMTASGATYKAVALAASAVTRFPGDARLYVAYAQLVQGEAPEVIARGVKRFPSVAELQLLRAQELRKDGRAGEAVEPLKRALAIDPTLGRGYLQLAQTQADLGELDSALVSVRRAVRAAEDSTLVAQFTLARGNALYKAAQASGTRDDLARAVQFVALADSLRSSPQSRFLLGAAALTLSQSAAADAPKTSACELSRLASSLLPLAREKLTAGAEVAPDASRQYLAYLDQLEPVVTRQLQTLCTGGGTHPR